MCAFVGVGDVEPWIADQPWKAVAGGWSVPGELQGWRFRLEVMPGALRVVMSAREGEPAVWSVLRREATAIQPLARVVRAFLTRRERP